MDAPWSFWCTPCKTHHSGECPPAAPARAPQAPVASGVAGGLLHDWEQLPVTSLSTPFRCRNCFDISRVALVSAMTGGAYPPLIGCAGEKPLAPRIGQMVRVEALDTTVPGSDWFPDPRFPLVHEYEVTSVDVANDKFGYRRGTVTGFLSLYLWRNHNKSTIRGREHHVRLAPVSS